MSVKEIKEAMEKKKVFFGIRQTMKNAKKSKNIFVAKNVRNETLEKLKSSKLEFVILKSKEDLAKELNLNFECEVFSIN